MDLGRMSVTFCTSLIAAVRFQAVRLVKTIRPLSSPLTVARMSQSRISIWMPRDGTIAMMKSAGSVFDTVERKAGYC